ncbi:MAG: nicotinate phosphoribosyltransferase [Bacteroidota bacterium]
MLSETNGYLSGTYTDQYQLAMSQAYYLNGMHHDDAIFDYFFRKLPFDGGYAVFAGLETLLDALENLTFTPQDMEFLSRQDFDKGFLDYLKDFRFNGNVYSTTEGDIVFSTRPVLTVEANIIEAQIAETLLLNLLNYQTLIATKARRMRETAGERTLIDFGMRRAHGPAAYHAARAAIIGGFDATSNVQAARDFDILASGTMAHSYVQAHDDELSAFRSFANARPNNCVLLVDTYDTLKSGVPNAIKVAREMEARGEKLSGIRLDSGDLAYLSKKARKMLDEAGLEDVKIAASNQLDEHLIKSLLDQQAPIDVFGVGTSLVTGKPDAALDGVYKMAFANGKPRIKLSENNEKITLPGKKQVHRVYDTNHYALGADVVSLWDEQDVSVMHHPFIPEKSLEIKHCLKEPLLHSVMENGKRLNKPKTVHEIARYSRERLNEISGEYRRFLNPHEYKIGLSPALKKERDGLINK